MTSSTDHQILFVGLPETGKTSFLAAFYHIAISTIPHKVWNQYRLSPDAEYINSIHEQWLQFKVQARTEQRSIESHKVVVYLENLLTNDKITLQVPDIAGEEFFQHWLNRSWQPDYESAAKSATGILLFLHADNFNSPVNLADVIHDIGDVSEAHQQDNGVNQNAHGQWSHQDAPTQVIAVDLLQFHLFALEGTKTLPIAIIISAWDMAKSLDGELTPDQWLASNMPLLNQFLIANHDSLTFKVYGVSAQGGDLGEKDSLNTLAEYDEPSDRIIVQDGSQTHKDIGAPVQWLIDTWKVLEQ